MIVNFVRTHTGTVAEYDLTRSCHFVDDQIWWDLQDYIKESCYYGIMGNGWEKFRPKDYVTRGEFATILSRVLWGDKYEI